MASQTRGDAGLKTLSMASDHFDPVELAPRMRGRYAPVHVAQEIDEVRLAAVPRDPEAEVTFEGLPAREGKKSGALRLSPGRNGVTVEVVAGDGKTRTIFSLLVFRDHPTPAWRRVLDAAPWAPRDSAGELVFDGRMWLFGGYTPGVVKDVWYLDVPGLTFVTQPVVEDFVGTSYVYAARADFGAARGAIAYRLINSPEWLRLDPASGRIEGIPPAAGEVEVTVEARDDEGQTARQSYTLHVLATA